MGELLTARTGSRGCWEQGSFTLTGFPEEGSFSQTEVSGVGLRMCEGWEGEFLGVWNCLLEGTEVKRMSLWLVVELKFQSLMMVEEVALGEIRCLDSNPRSAVYRLCDLGHVI